MKCPKCGEDCNSGVWFCDACGCDLRESMKKAPGGAKVYSGEENNYFEYKDLQSQEGGKKPSKPIKKRNKGQVVSIVITVTLLAIVALAGIFIYQTLHKEPYEKKLDEIADLFNNRTANIDKYGEAILPDHIWKDTIALGEAEYDESGRNSGEYKVDINIQMKSLMDSIDSDLKIEFKVENARKLGKDELDEIAKSYTHMSQIINAGSKSGDELKDQGMMKSYEAYQKLINDFIEMEFEEGYELDVTMIATDGDDKEEKDVKITMVKANDKWMVDFMHYLNEIQSILGNYFH